MVVSQPWTSDFSVLRLLLLFRHSAMSLNAQKERMASSLLLVTRLQRSDANLKRLHVRQSNVVIITPETVVIVGV